MLLLLVVAVKVVLLVVVRLLLVVEISLVLLIIVAIKLLLLLKVVALVVEKWSVLHKIIRPLVVVVLLLILVEVGVSIEESLSFVEVRVGHKIVLSVIVVSILVVEVVTHIAIVLAKTKALLVRHKVWSVLTRTKLLWMVEVVVWSEIARALLLEVTLIRARLIILLVLSKLIRVEMGSQLLLIKVTRLAIIVIAIVGLIGVISGHKLIQIDTRRGNVLRLVTRLVGPLPVSLH